ncbi:DNA topoisomerase, partial [Magnetococcales bacterium HHB-1]
AAAKINQVRATISVSELNPKAAFLLRATGSSVAFDGFRKIYNEGTDEVSIQDRDPDAANTMLPPLEKGETLLNKEIKSNQHFTEPPPRYTEATLVKVLESYGIGRPSTYAPIMSTLQDRGYVRLEKRKFFPEDIGIVVNSFLVDHFQNYVDYHFTAHLEDDLDAISRGEKAWVPLLDDFWKPFIDRVQDRDKNTSKSELLTEETDEECPKCGKPLVIKLGRFGKFKACTGYPECRFTEDLQKKEGEEGSSEPEVSDQTCEKCGKPMLIKTGRYGKYYACSGYPDCRNNQPLHKPEDTGVPCPECGKGTFLAKRSRRGKIFFSCSEYPKCKKALWDRPITKECPECQAPFLTIKITKRRGTEHVCVNDPCEFREVIEPPEGKTIDELPPPPAKRGSRKTAAKATTTKKRTTKTATAAKKTTRKRTTKTGAAKTTTRKKTTKTAEETEPKTAAKSTAKKNATRKTTTRKPAAKKTTTRKRTTKATSSGEEKAMPQRRAAASKKTTTVAEKSAPMENPS